MARVKLSCTIGCPGLKSSYREKGLLLYFYFNNFQSSRKLLENIRVGVSFLIKLKTQNLQLYYKKTLTQVFSCEISKNVEEHLFYRTASGSSHLDVFSKNCLFKSFEKFTEKHQAWRPATLLKRDSSTGVFQSILQKF